MKDTALIIQPPNGRAYEIPYGTLPALTGALRTNGYKVIQRDLNIETLLDLLNPEAGNKLVNRLQNRVQALNSKSANRSIKEDLIFKIKQCDFIKSFIKNNFPFLLELSFVDKTRKVAESKEFGLSHKLNLKIKAFNEIIPLFEQTKNAFIAETKDGKPSSNTYTLLSKIYSEYFSTIDLLSTPDSLQNSYFDNLADKDNNFYYYVLEKFIEDFNWEEIIFVGITITQACKQSALTLADMIRKKHPHIHVALGGEVFVDVDVNDKEDIRDLKEMLTRYADSIVINEGDTAIVRIMDCLMKRKDWDEVPNLIRLIDGEVYMKQPFYIEKLDDLALYDFEGLPIQYYPGLPVEISRGCYWLKCTFCRKCMMTYGKTNFTKNSPYYRRHKIDRIVSEVDDLQKKYNKNFFDFINLAVSPREMKELCKAIIDAKLKINFSNLVRLEKNYTPELLELMAEAGIPYYHIHPETFSKNTNKLHNKNYDIDHIKSLINYWIANKDRLPPLLINIFTGFPGETFEDFLESYNYIKESAFSVQGIALFEFVKHSDVYYNPEKYGVKVIKERNNASVFNHFKHIWRDDIAKERVKIEVYLRTHNKEWLSLASEWDFKTKILYDN